VNISAPVTQTAYNLDALGNWLSKISDGVTENRTHNVMNEISDIDGTSYTYDDNGNLIDDGTNIYEYDYENHLIEKQVSTITTAYYYDSYRVVEEQVDSLTQAIYIYGNSIDEVAAMERDGQTLYYLTNSLDSIVALTDTAGNVVEQYHYDPYGKPCIFDGLGTQLSNSAVENPYLFTGRRYDQESGLQYSRYRYLSYKLGRWMTRDPIGYEDDLNFYAYVNNSPTNWTDPFGRRSRRRGGDFESDWAGRAILWRYLTGGGDWNIQNDPRWTAYMQENHLLKMEMKLILYREARKLCDKPNGYSNTFDITRHVAIENGEGIIGYQYLHGTNANVGDFQINGKGTRGTGGPDPKCCTVNFDVHYQWNDVIDPNPQYGTDTLKSIFAEIITLGKAEAYTIRIGWDAKSTYKNNGGQISHTGWPLTDP
jgi:RHS repeat-associated protein